MSAFREFGEHDGLGLAELVRRGKVSPVELVEEAIGRIEAINPHLNAVIHPMYDLARQAAEGSLPDGTFRGVPFLLKDLLADYAGVPTRSGSRFHDGHVPDHDTEMVKRFKGAGVIVLGKANASEYGLMPVTEPSLFGPTNNPWDPTRTAGGSSGGSAAAVAAGMVPLAHGSDGGGSIRIPASCCGVFGLKPTRGRNPMGPDLGEGWHGLITDHVLTRSVRDSAAMLDATAGSDVGAPYYAEPPRRPFLDEVTTEPGKLRIAFTAEPLLPADVHPDCVKGLEVTIDLCEELGHEVEEAAPRFDQEAFLKAYLTVMWTATRANIEEAELLVGRKATFREFDLETWIAGLLGGRITAPRFSLAIRLLQRVSRQVAHFFQNYDVLVTPTLAAPPLATGELRPTGREAFALKLLGRLNAGRTLWRLGALEAAATDSKVFGFVPNTPLFSVTGQPAMSVPLYWNEEEIPIGMQFTGRYGDEATLFRLGGQLERARPWFERIPPTYSEQPSQANGMLGMRTPERSGGRRQRDGGALP